MKVLLISPYPPARDGIGEYSAQLRAALVADGAQVAVVSGRPSPRPEVLGCLVGSDLRQLAARVAAWRPDVIHVQHAMAAYGAAVVRLWRLVATIRHATGSPVVVTHHEVTRDLARTGTAGRIYYRRTARHANIVHVHTAGAAAAYTELAAPGGPAPIVLAHPVAALPAPTIGPTDLRRRHALGARPLILCFGFVQIDKGLDLAVRAMAALRHAPGPAGDAVLAVVGEVRRRPALLKPYEWIDHLHLKHVRRLIGGLGIADRVLATGYCPDSEIAAWFAAADVVLLPYRRAEQSGVAQFALAADAKVLAAPTGGLVDLFADTDALLPQLDVATIASSLQHVINSALPHRTSQIRRARFADLRGLYPCFGTADERLNARLAKETKS